ncbi:hypothetical protein CB1_000210005 [Camelus ferus]|nr:hypothetical protein CB1_000210005 [Camelus ferus]
MRLLWGYPPQAGIDMKKSKFDSSRLGVFSYKEGPKIWGIGEKRTGMKLGVERSAPREADGQENVETSADERCKEHGLQKCSTSQNAGIVELEPFQVMSNDELDRKTA